MRVWLAMGLWWAAIMVTKGHGSQGERSYDACLACHGSVVDAVWHHAGVVGVDVAVRKVNTHLHTEASKQIKTTHVHVYCMVLTTYSSYIQ